jgi:hypothetical protein
VNEQSLRQAPYPGKIKFPGGGPMKLFFILALVFGGISKAQAAFFVEPEIGYSNSQQLKYSNAGTNYTYGETSALAGVRLGYMMSSGLWLGAHGEYYSNGTLTSTASGGSSSSFSRQTASAELGWQVKNFRFFGGYQFLNTLSITPSPSDTHIPSGFSGNGQYAGLGIQFGSRFNLHLMYEVYTYTNVTGQNSSSQSLAGSAFSNVSDSNLVLMGSMSFNATEKK